MVIWPKERALCHFQLLKSIALAVLIECLFILIVGNHNRVLIFSRLNPSTEVSQWIETEVFELPQKPQLIEAQKAKGSHKHLQETLLQSRTFPLLQVKSAGFSTQHTPVPSGDEESNQTQAEPSPFVNHGPIITYAPRPVLPAHFHHASLKAEVLIEFQIDSTGKSTPHLVCSSGRTELDTLALESVRRWRFQPAEREGKTIAAKIRLRIIFQVEEE